MSFYSDYWSSQNVRNRALEDDVTPGIKKCYCKYKQEITVTYAKEGTEQYPLYRYDIRYKSKVTCPNTVCNTTGWDVGAVGETHGGGTSGGMFYMQRITCGDCDCNKPFSKKGDDNFHESDEDSPVGPKGLPSPVSDLLTALEGGGSGGGAPYAKVEAACLKKIDAYTNGGGTTAPSADTVEAMCKGEAIIP